MNTELPDRIEQPDQILDDLRDAIRRWEGTRRKSWEESAAAEDVTNRMERLDRWLSNGGYLPRAWRSPWPDSMRPGHSPRSRTPEYNAGETTELTEENWEDAEDVRRRRGCLEGCCRIDEHEGGPCRTSGTTVRPSQTEPTSLGRPIKINRRQPPAMMRYYADQLMEYAKTPTSYETGTKMTRVALALEALADAMDRGHWIFQPEVSRGRQYETGQVAAPPGVQFKTERRLADVRPSTQYSFDVRPSTQYSFTVPDGAYSGTFNSDGSGELFIEGQDEPVKFTKEELKFSKVLDVEEPIPDGQVGQHIRETWPHIRTETYGAGGSAGGLGNIPTHANVRPETAEAAAGAAYRVAETWSDLAALLRRAEEANRTERAAPDFGGQDADSDPDAEDRRNRDAYDRDKYVGDDPDARQREHPGPTIQAGALLFAIADGLSRANLNYAISDSQVTVTFDEDEWSVRIDPCEPPATRKERGTVHGIPSALQRFVQEEGWYIHKPCGERMFEVEDGSRMGNVIRELLKHDCSDGGGVDNT